MPGSNKDKHLAKVIGPAARGDRIIEVDQPETLERGESIRIRLRDDQSLSLIDYLYAGDTGPTAKLQSRHRQTDFVARVTSVRGPPHHD